MRTRLIKITIGLLILGLVFYSVNFKELLATFSHITWQSIIYLAILSVLLIGVSAFKWQLFLKRVGQHVSLIKLFNLYLVGYFINLLMPSYVGGDVVRSLYAGRGKDQHQTFSATFLERYTGLVAMIVMAAIGLGFSPFVTTEMKYAVILVAIGMVVGSIALFSGFANKIFRKLRLPEKILSHLDKIQGALRFAVSDFRLIAMASLLSLLFHVLTVVNTVVVAEAIGWYNPPVVDLFVAVPLILLVASIPVAPQGLGIAEGAFFYFLTRLGATPEQALGVSLLLRAKGYVLALLGGFVWWGLSSDRDGFQPSYSEG